MAASVKQELWRQTSRQDKRGDSLLQTTLSTNTAHQVAGKALAPTDEVQRIIFTQQKPGMMHLMCYIHYQH